MSGLTLFIPMELMTPSNYTTLCRRQKHIDIVISYQKSSDGLHLLMDSTG
ncbi:hypothetical protein BUE68_12200, partial [Corynebacterium diphtheriae]